ncbi:MAG: arginine--tRNA ligase, partial [Clostridia bacterium]|nr:arginine--tRNA ligase [Clostridia bacterium]
MSYIVKEVQQQLRQAVMASVQKAFENGEIQVLPEKDFIVETPADSANGDFSTNAAMAWARELRMAPVKIAGIIIKNIDLGSTYFQKCECAGPGFLNFYLDAKYYAAILKDVKAKGENYGHSDYGAGKK